MNNFWQRAITGAVFVTVVVGLTLYNAVTFLALLMLIGAGSLYEYYSIVFKKKIGFMQIAYLLLGVGLIGTYFWIGGYKDLSDSCFGSLGPTKDGIIMIFGFTLIGLIILFALTAIGVLLSKERNWRHIGYLISGLLYISLPLLLFYLSAFQSSGYGYKATHALNLFILIWCSDTFAYLCGRAFGKHKLFESVSPKKTWEGFIGGGILTIASSFLLAYYFHLPYYLNFAIAFSTVVFGSLGDLVQSMLKREFDVKDSGTILPGHGGVLDRFDALLISLPFTTFCYFLAYYF